MGRLVVPDDETTDNENKSKQKIAPLQASVGFDSGGNFRTQKSDALTIVAQSRRFGTLKRRTSSVDNVF